MPTKSDGFSKNPEYFQTLRDFNKFPQTSKLFHKTPIALGGS